MVPLNVGAGGHWCEITPHKFQNSRYNFILRSMNTSKNISKTTIPRNVHDGGERREAVVFVLDCGAVVFFLQCTGRYYIH